MSSAAAPTPALAHTPHDGTAGDSLNKNAQLACAYAGPAIVVIWVVSFIVLAGFIPPPTGRRSPRDSR